LEELYWCQMKTKVPALISLMPNFLSSWEIVKEDMKHLLVEFHSHGKLSKWLLSYFITLIQKVINRNTITEWSVFKILAKVLAIRLSQSRGKLIWINWFHLTNVIYMDMDNKAFVFWQIKIIRLNMKEMISIKTFYQVTPNIHIRLWFNSMSYNTYVTQI
jgi:hypothetical protein